MPLFVMAPRHLVIILAVAMWSTHGEMDDVGPLFVNEPPYRLDFSNSSGSRLDCLAHGSPQPRITWHSSDGSLVTDVDSLRKVYSNGTVVFPPFRAEDYRQDVHANLYVCMASNAAGAIISREVNVRGVAKQYYELQVYDEFVIVENTGVLRCHIPSFVEDYVSVSSWVREDGIVHGRDNNGGRFFLTANGDLYVANVVSGDMNKTYRCKTLHRLTGEERLSSPGRIIVTDPKSSVPPRITHTKPLIQVQEGGTVELPCAAQGFPTPSYRWLRVHGKGAVPVQQDPRVRQVLSLLVLDKVHSEDAGVYRCLVFNSMGEEKTEIALRVTAQLSVHVTPQRQTVDVGKECRLSCVINGFPVTSVSWVKNGKSLAPTGRFKLLSREVLQISDVHKEDKGMYQCVVGNGEEMAQGAAEVKLGNVAPVVHLTYPERPMRSGSPVALKCVAFGNPPPEISWQVDDIPLPPQPYFHTPTGEVISYLNLTRVRLEDGGEYRCVGKNPGGSQHHAGRLQVIGPPLVLPMKNITAVAGKSITIKCRVTGHPLDSINWEKDGSVLPTDHRQKVHENGTLHIHQVDKASDQGIYTCIARNRQGLVSRNWLGLFVKVPPTIGPFSFPPILHDGMRARLQCVVTQGDLPIVITWLMDEHRIPADLGLTVRQDDDFSSTLTFPSVSTRHSGRYRCIASNEAGTANYSAPLVVDVMPTWIVQPADKAIVVKGYLTLDCRADGYPDPVITWKKATGRFRENFVDLNRTGIHFTHFPNGSLQLMAVSESDEGFYMCHAANGVGAGLSKVVYVTVQAAAHFEEKRRNHTAKRGDSVKMECRATGDSPITITWQSSAREFFSRDESRFIIKEKPLDNGMLSEMTIVNAVRKDSGTYSCTARNTFGHDQMMTQLIILEAPEAPENVKIADHGSRLVKLLWSMPFDGSSPIAKYIIQYKNGSEEWASSLPNVTVAGQETSAVIRGLLPGTAYSFRVMAANELGIGKPSSGVGISTTEEAPAGFPQDVQVIALGSDALRVTCKPPGKSLWNGEILGYVVSYKLHQLKEMPSVKTVETNADLSAQIILDGLRKYTKYSVVVQAYNRMGRGPPTPEIFAYTAEDVPSKPPRMVQCTSLASQSLQLKWEEPQIEYQNGVLLGYKVLYGLFDGTDDGDESSKTQTATTSDTQLPLYELKKYANYTLRVLAYTKIGNGMASEPVHCMTKEDVPGSPANIKALAMSSDSIRVTWKAPFRPNGQIIKYNVYMRALDDNNKKASKHTVTSPVRHFFEAKGLSENKRYEFWVTASTNVGEGESTKVILRKPTFKATASIASFSEIVVVWWQRNVTLECHSLGMPTPTTNWMVKGEPWKEDSRAVIINDNSLILTQVQRDDAGNYSCYAENIYGNDNITYTITVLAPPLPPVLSVVWETASSIGLMWKETGDGGSKIKGYVLNYKQDFGKWLEVQLVAGDDKYSLDNLLCGTRYHLHLTAYNQIGVGNHSIPVVAVTKGSPPLLPRREDVITANATLFTVSLVKWPDGGCPVQYFVVEYKSRHQEEWTLISNNLTPQHEIVVVPDLRPQTWYTLRIVANNEAGSTVALFEVATLAYAGGTVGPGVLVRSPSSSLPFYRDVSVVVPIIASTILTLTVIVGVCFCFRRKRRSLFRQEIGTPEKKAALAADYDASRGSTGVRKIHPPASCDINRGVLLNTGNATEDVCPYATFRLPLHGNKDNDDSYQLQSFTLSSEKAGGGGGGGGGSLCNSQQRASSDLRREDLYSKINKRPVSKLPEEEHLYKKESQGSDIRPYLSRGDVELSSGQIGSGYQLPDYDTVTGGSPELGGYNRTPNGPLPRTVDVGHTWDHYGKHTRRFPDLLYHGPDSNSSDEMEEDGDVEEDDGNVDKCRWTNPKETLIGWADPCTRHPYQTWSACAYSTGLPCPRVPTTKELHSGCCPHSSRSAIDDGAADRIFGGAFLSVGMVDRA